jgi:hypothetical protein
MEYVMILILQLIGIGFHVAQKVNALDKQHPEKTIKEIYGLFFENEWSSLSISALVLVADLMFHFIVGFYFPQLKERSFHIPYLEVTLPFLATSFMAAFVLGYAGQRLAYKYLGKAEQYLSDKAK